MSDNAKLPFGSEPTGSKPSSDLPFTVLVDDNFNYQDESERYAEGSYSTYAEALAVCKKIVDQWLTASFTPDKSADELYSAYVGFGEDPFIVGPETGAKRFSAWEYAKAQCNAMFTSAPDRLTPLIDPKEHADMETPSNSIALLLAASDFAAQKHRDQRRKGGDAAPYINHPIAVANLLVNEAEVNDPITLSAAILHDTIEDTDTTAEELENAFGSEVAAVVVEVTDDKLLPKQERKRLQIEHAGQLSHRAQLVKLADKICNLRDMVRSPPVDWPLERRREYFVWAKQVIDQMRGQNPVLDRLVGFELSRSP